MSLRISLLVLVLLLGGCASSPARLCPRWFALSLLETAVIGSMVGPASYQLTECAKDKAEDRGDSCEERSGSWGACRTSVEEEGSVKER